MRTARKLLLNLPLIASAAAWAPLAQLVLLAEQQCAEHGDARFQIVLAETFKTAAPISEETDSQPRQQQPRLLKPITEHLDTASGAHFGTADVPVQSAAFTFAGGRAHDTVRELDAYAALHAAAQRARGPPVPQA